MDYALNILIWSVAAVAGIFVIFFIIGLIIAISEQIKKYKGEGKEPGQFIQNMSKHAYDRVKGLGTIPVIVIGIWYLFILTTVVYIAYDLLLVTPSISQLQKS